MRNEPLVSIGCAVYNGERTLDRALGPLVGQDYANLEILIADDRSTDRSLEICERFASADSRVRIIRNQHNVGLLQNFNNLFAAAKGQYFMWADQDDIRDPTFVRRAVAALEADPRAVLCHSHTGAFIGDPEHLRYVITLDGVAGVEPLVRRYFRFLRRFSDTVIYGLIRSQALRQTKLWRRDLGSGNALLFELLIAGTFIQIPDVLYRYSGLGLPNRPDASEEYARCVGTRMPRYYVPFLAVALNQTDGIRRSSASWPQKVALLGVLWAHVAVVALTKLFYRIAYRMLGGRIPGSLTGVCERIVNSHPDMIFIDDAQLDVTVFPRSWELLGESLRTRHL
jgi:glycosyltransferase involved in cell wall biosynthesis